MRTNLGSYTLSSLESPEAERERLELQAGALWNVELAFLQSAGLTEGSRVLDLGCGNGCVAERIARSVPGAAVTGVDRDKNILPEVSNNNVCYLHLYDGMLPPELGEFELIYARFLLQHLADPGEILESAVRHLKPGGAIALLDSDDALFFLDPPDNDLDELLSRARMKQGLAGGDRNVGRKLPRLLLEAGLVVESHRFYHLSSLDRTFQECYLLATGFKAALLGESQAFARIGKRLIENAQRDQPFLSVGVSAAIGRRLC